MTPTEKHAQCLAWLDAAEAYCERSHACAEFADPPDAIRQLCNAIRPLLAGYRALLPSVPDCVWVDACRPLPADIALAKEVPADIALAEEVPAGIALQWHVTRNLATIHAALAQVAAALGITQEEQHA